MALTWRSRGRPSWEGSEAAGAGAPGVGGPGAGATGAPVRSGLLLSTRGSAGPTFELAGTTGPAPIYTTCVSVVLKHAIYKYDIFT